jgi:hypothetical protein
MSSLAIADTLPVRLLRDGRGRQRNGQYWVLHVPTSPRSTRSPRSAHSPLPAHTTQHVEAWSKMLAGSSPPIASTPITPFLDEHAFRSECELLTASCSLRAAHYVPCRPGPGKASRTHHRRRIIADAPSPTHHRRRIIADASLPMHLLTVISV